MDKEPRILGGEANTEMAIPPNGSDVREYPANKGVNPIVAKSKETLAYEKLLKIVKSSSIVEVEKEMGKNDTSGKDNSVFCKAEKTLACEDITNITMSDDESEEENESISPPT